MWACRRGRPRAPSGLWAAAACAAGWVLALGLAGCGAPEPIEIHRDAVAAPEAPAADGLGSIRARGYIRVGVFGDFAPFGYLDKDGENAGFDVDLARRLAYDLFGDERQVQFEILDAPGRVRLLQTGAADVTLAYFTVTPERLGKVDFSLPYMKTSFGVVAPVKAPVRELSDLKGRRLIVVRGSVADVWFAGKAPQIERVAFDASAEAFAALKAGKGDALALDSATLYVWTASHPKFAVTWDGQGPLEFIAPAVKKGNDSLRIWLDKEIASLHKEGFFLWSFQHSVEPLLGPDARPGGMLIDDKTLADYKAGKLDQSGQADLGGASEGLQSGSAEEAAPARPQDASAAAPAPAPAAKAQGNQAAGRKKKAKAHRKPGPEMALF